MVNVIVLGVERFALVTDARWLWPGVGLWLRARLPSTSLEADRDGDGWVSVWELARYVDVRHRALLPEHHLIRLIPSSDVRGVTSTSRSSSSVVACRICCSGAAWPVSTQKQTGQTGTPATSARGL